MSKLPMKEVTVNGFLGNIDMSKVDDTSLADVHIDSIVSELEEVMTRISELGLALRINEIDMEILNFQHANSVNKAQDLLVGVITLYLDKKYNPDYGEPTWRGLVYAVNRVNPALAEQLAEEHPAVPTTSPRKKLTAAHYDVRNIPGERTPIFHQHIDHSNSEPILHQPQHTEHHKRYQSEISPCKLHTLKSQSVSEGSGRKRGSGHGRGQCKQTDIYTGSQQHYEKSQSIPKYSGRKHGSGRGRGKQTGTTQQDKGPNHSIVDNNSGSSPINFGRGHGRGWGRGRRKVGQSQAITEAKLRAAENKPTVLTQESDKPATGGHMKAVQIEEQQVTFHSDDNSLEDLSLDTKSTSSPAINGDVSNGLKKEKGAKSADLPVAGILQKNQPPATPTIVQKSSRIDLQDQNMVISQVINISLVGENASSEVDIEKDDVKRKPSHYNSPDISQPPASMRDHPDGSLPESQRIQQQEKDGDVTLNTKHAGSILEILNEARDKWYYIAKGIEVDDADRDEIQSAHLHDNLLCLDKMLERRIKRGGLTRSMLCASLRRRFVERDDLAQKIEALDLSSALKQSGKR